MPTTKQDIGRAGDNLGDFFGALMGHLQRKRQMEEYESLVQGAPRTPRQFDTSGLQDQGTLEMDGQGIQNNQDAQRLPVSGGGIDWTKFGPTLGHAAVTNPYAARGLDIQLKTAPKGVFAPPGSQPGTMGELGEGFTPIGESIPHRPTADRKLGETTGSDNIKWAKFKREDGTTYFEEIGDNRMSPGFGIQQTNQVETLKNQFNDLDREATDLSQGLYRSQNVKALFPDRTDADIKVWSDAQREITLKEMESKASAIEKIEGKPFALRSKIKRESGKPKQKTYKHTATNAKGEKVGSDDGVTWVKIKP